MIYSIGGILANFFNKQQSFHNSYSQNCGYGLTNPIVITIFIISIIAFIFFLSDGASLKKSIIIGGICVFCPLYLYLFPSIIALSKKHPEFFVILVTNLFLGGTVIGWLVALIWGSRKF